MLESAKTRVSIVILTKLQHFRLLDSYHSTDRCIFPLSNIFVFSVILSLSMHLWKKQLLSVSAEAKLITTNMKCHCCILT